MLTAIEIQAVQDHFGLPEPSAVEKDWHVTRALRAINAVDPGPFRVVFGGGTCLARAHKLVPRMSEDADLKVVAPEPAALSNNQRRKLLGELRDRVTSGLLAAGFSFDVASSAHLRSRDGNRYTVFRLPYALAADSGSTLRPNIQIELNFSTMRLPTVTRPVASLYAEAFRKAPEIEAIDCVSVTETAAEKLVALTRRTAMILAGANRGEPDDTLVRHIFDLHSIRDRIDRAVAIELARDIARQDAEEFGNQHPAYRDDIAGEAHRAVMHLLNEAEPHAQYDQFVSTMVYGPVPVYEEAMETVAELASAAWPH